jgi:manganese transport protein
VASIIVALNGKLVYDEITGWLEASENLLFYTVVPLALSFDIITVYRFAVC